MGCCASKPAEDEMRSARNDYSVESIRHTDDDDDERDTVAVARPTQKAKKATKTADKSNKRLTVRLYADALAEQQEQSAVHERMEEKRKSLHREDASEREFLASPEAKKAKAAADAAAHAATSERMRKETWSALETLVDSESTKRHTLVVRERAEYQPGANNDVDVPLALDALCVMSLCLQKEPIPFDTLQTAHAQLAKELAKLDHDAKRAYYEPAVFRNRYGVGAVQTGKRRLADAVHTARQRTERLRERIDKSAALAAKELNEDALQLLPETEQRTIKLQVRQPLLQAVQLHWDDMRAVLDAMHPLAPMSRLSQLRDTLQEFLDEALQAALSVVRETSEPCEPFEIDRVADAVTRALFNVIGFAALLTRNALDIGDVTRQRGMSDNIWLLVKGARMLAVFAVELASGTDDGIEQQRMARTLKSLVQGMTRRLDTILDAAAGESESIQYYTVDKPLREHCETELRAAAAELVQANELFGMQTSATPNALVGSAIDAITKRVSAYDVLLVSVAPTDLVKHTRRLGSEVERAVSLLVRIALRANPLPLYKDALFEALQAATHHALQLRVLGGVRALDYNVVIYHGALVALCRQLCGALAAALQFCSTLAVIGAAEVLQPRDGDSVVLPQVLPFVMQYVGAELGRTKQAADSVSTAVRSNLDVDVLLLDVARSAKEDELRKFEEEKRLAALRREEERRASQDALLAELDTTAADVDADVIEIGPEPPKPVGFDENMPYTQEMHGDYRAWAKEKYNYAEWLRKKTMRDGHKQELTVASKRLSLKLPPTSAAGRAARVEDDDDDAPRAPPPVRNLAAVSASATTRSTLRGADVAKADAAPQKPEPLKPGATSAEYKAYMKAKFYYEEWQNKQQIAARKSQQN